VPEDLPTRSESAGLLSSQTCVFSNSEIPGGDPQRPLRRIRAQFPEGLFSSGPGKAGPIQVPVNSCTAVKKCLSCPELQVNGGRGSISERLGSISSRFLEDPGKALRAAKAWIVYEAITFGRPK
jgi:hypothetical protein